jgi:hypothetical protein
MKVIFTGDLACTSREGDRYGAQAIWVNEDMQRCH